MDTAAGRQRTGQNIELLLPKPDHEVRQTTVWSSSVCVDDWKPYQWKNNENILADEAPILRLPYQLFQLHKIKSHLNNLRMFTRDKL